MLRRLIRGAGWVALGTAIGQGTALAATPYLARVFHPAEFGALAMLTSVSNIALAAACLRFDLALPSATTREAPALLRLCIVSCLATAAFTWAVLLLLPHLPFGERPAAVPPFSVPLVVALCVFLVGTYQAAAAGLLQRGAYRGVGTLRLSQGVTFSALSAGTPLGLLWAHALSFTLGVVACWRSLRSAPASQADAVREAARRHKALPLVSLPGALLDVAGYSICVWTLTSAYGLTQAGQYSQIQRLIGAPLMLLSISLGQVLLRQSAELAHVPAEMRQLLLKTLSLLVRMALAGLLFLALAGEPLLGWLLGPGWRVDREFVLLIAVAVFVRACVSPLSSVLITLRRFDLGLAWQALYFAAAATLLPAVAFHQTPTVFLRFYAVHECVLYGVYLWFIRRAIVQPTCAESSV